MVVGPCTYFSMFPWPFWARGHADVLPPHCFSPGSSNHGRDPTGVSGVRGDRASADTALPDDFSGDANTIVRKAMSQAEEEVIFHRGPGDN